MPEHDESIIEALVGKNRGNEDEISLGKKVRKKGRKKKEKSVK